MLKRNLHKDQGKNFNDLVFSKKDLFNVEIEIRILDFEFLREKIPQTIFDLFDNTLTSPRF